MDKTTLMRLKKYKEPNYGSFKWLSCQAGMQKVSSLISNDKDVKEALYNLIALSVQEAITLNKQLKNGK